MSLTLKSFGQEVNMEDGGDVSYFAIFRADDGRELRLPIPQEASQVLIDFAFGAKKAVEAHEEVTSILKEAREQEVAEEEDLQAQGASVFGEDEEPQEEQEYAEEPDDDTPASEEEVQSL